MSLFTFELKKIWRQRKLFWLIVISLLCTSWIVMHNQFNQPMKEENARDILEVYQNESDDLYGDITMMMAQGTIDE